MVSVDHKNPSYHHFLENGMHCTYWSIKCVRQGFIFQWPSKIFMKRLVLHSDRYETAKARQLPLSFCLFFFSCNWKYPLWRKRAIFSSLLQLLFSRQCVHILLYLDYHVEKGKSTQYTQGRCYALFFIFKHFFFLV